MSWWETIVVGVLVSAAALWLIRLAVLTLRGSNRGGCGCGCAAAPTPSEAKAAPNESTRMRVRELVKLNVGGSGATGESKHQQE